MFFPVRGEYGSCDVQVLDVVYFIPCFASEAQRLDFRLVQQGDDPQHLFVIFIIAQGFTVGCKKGDVMGPGEFPAEFVNIDGFKIFRLFFLPV